MKKLTPKKTALVAAAFVASMNLNACAYGPEPVYDDPDPGNNIATYDPDDNMNQCVYGPPEFFYDDNDDFYDPSADEPEEVYGPPPEYLQ